jgi:O-antigen ligase
VAVSLATRPLAPSLRKARAAAPTTFISARSAVLSLALLPLFLHADWQPGVALDVGSTSLAIELSDVAVLAVVATAVAVGLREGFGPLRHGWPLWLAAIQLGGWIVLATLYGPLVLDGYPTLENLVTTAKFLEYALLAPAIALLVRSREDLRLPLTVLVGWCALAVAVALAQWLGADVFDAWAAGRRQPSFLGHHDFAAVAGAVFLTGLAAYLLAPRESPWLRALALAAGGLGLVLAAAVASLLGLLLAVPVLAIAALDRYAPARRLIAAAAMVVVVALGVLALRGGDVADFLRFAQDEDPAKTSDVETYSHRTLLAYIGGRIFLDHPLAGVGWQGSSEPAAFEPYLEDAHRRFPGAAPLAFPAPERRHGVQNVYVQTLADLGIVGFALLVGLLAAALLLAFRAMPATTALLGVLWLLFAVGLWAAQGLVTGIPLAALTWIAFGLIAANGRS